jgi:putative hydrolase of the HAD superfamily
VVGTAGREEASAPAGRGFGDGPARALLIDLDGVLRRWEARPGEPVEAAFGLPAGALAEAAFEADLLEAAVLGQIEDEEWRRRVAERLGTRYGSGAAGAVAAWSAPAGAVDPEVLALVRAVRRRAPVCLVTNATTRLERDLERLGLAGELDAIASSARVGARKPDAPIYRAALALAGVPAPAALFVDDTPGHVAAARALGLRGHVFAGAAGLAGALRAAGLL